jgi:hypothetical protein
MSAPRRRRSARDALVLAMLGDPRPDPSLGVPPVAELDLAGFWPRFDARAPLHLAAGFRVATLAIARVLPRAMGHARGLGALAPDQADAVVQRAASLRALAPLAEVAKVVACFAYFADDRFESAYRGAR